MTDIKLQPTDRCVLDYGTTTTTTTTTEKLTVTMKNSSGASGGALGFMYTGSVTQRFTSGKIVSVQLAVPSAAGTEFTVTKISDIAYRVVAERLTTIYEGASLSEIVMIKVTYTKEVVDKREVFQIYDDEGKMLWCKHKPVYVVFDESQIAMVEMDETDDRGGGGLVEFTESGEEELIPAGWVWTVFKVHCREGYELDTIELNGVAGTIIDLTDIASLTLDDFEEVEIAVRAKAVIQIDPTQRIIDLQYILDQEKGLLNTNTITTEYREYVDSNTEYDEALQEGQRYEDTFVAYGYLTPPWGEAAVPVIYKTDYSHPDVIDEGYPPDYEDIYYYVGQGQVNGVLYDKWRKIDDQFSHAVQQEKYLYTNIITRDLLEGPIIESVTTGYNTDSSHYYVEVTLSKPDENNYTYYARATVVADGYTVQTRHLFSSIVSGPVTSSNWSLGNLNQLRTDCYVGVTAIFRDPASGHQISTATVYETNLSS